VKIKLNSIQIKCKLPILNYVKKDDEFLINLNYCTETVIHIRVEIFLRQMRIPAHAPQSNFFCELGIPFPFGRGAGGGGGV
jgi:hypothetical protein